MKFWWAGIVAAILWASPAQAQVAYQSFSADITINTDASIAVTETVTVNFSEERHGIFRVIPYRYELGDGNVGSMPILVHSVQQDGQPAQYSVTSDERDVTIKIGDPDATISGPHTYIITYAAEAAVNFFSDHDELYWNVTGNDWPETFDTVAATVWLPGKIPPMIMNAQTYNGNISIGGENFSTVCYTGATGSTAQDCQKKTQDSQAVFSSRDFMTVVVGWPKGIVSKPANYDALRQLDASQGSANWFKVVLWANIIFPFIVAIGLWWHWRRHGRDPKDGRTIIAQYDPPPGLTPGEMGVLFDEQANHRDIVATIVDMAVRGYLDITELEEKKMFGLKTSKDYLLTRKNKDTTGLRGHERDLMDALFTTDTVKLSDLKGTFADDIKLLQKDLYQQVAEAGYFHSNPDSTRKTLLGIGGGMIFAAFFAIQVLFGLLVAGIVLMIFAKFMPKRTDTGVEALWQAKGFKLFLEKAEKYRLQWQEREHIFEKFLPYAMALGVAEKWSQAFAGLNQPPPSWYHGSDTFNTIVLWSALNNFSTATAHSFSPPAASGGSGFGGGGFSGGGGGGGGGGSW